MFLASSSDPTGLSSPLAEIAVLAVLVAAVVTGVRALWINRRRK